MNKFFLVLAIFFFSANIFAKDLIQCPETITCENRDAKLCNIKSGWYLGSEKINLKTLSIIGIDARLRKGKVYQMNCYYDSGYPSFPFNLHSSLLIKPTGPGWKVMSNILFICSTNNPAFCQGE